jgi:hypothetical protein
VGLNVSPLLAVEGAITRFGHHIPVPHSISTSLLYLFNVRVQQILKKCNTALATGRLQDYDVFIIAVSAPS